MESGCITRELIIIDQQNTHTKDLIMEGIVPLAINVGKQMEISNVKKVDMDEEDLEDNIKNVVDEADLSPKKA